MNEGSAHQDAAGPAHHSSLNVVAQALPFLPAGTRIGWNLSHRQGDGLSPQDLERVSDRRQAASASNVESDDQPVSDHAIPLGGRSKRILDVAVCAPVLLVMLPLMLLIALVVKLSNGGSVFFAHERVGFNGRKFNCYKFRTMVPDAQDVLASYLASDAQANAEWIAHQKLRHDPRITLLGHMLRRSSLDELPQLFNILRGDMSCVGPRPVMAAELSRYGPLKEHYLRTRPGLTGLWQVSGRNTLDYASRVMLDTQYVQAWTLGMDLLILFATIGAVLKFDQTH